MSAATLNDGGDLMAKKYEGVYIGLAELVLELSERPTMEDKGVFIDQVVKCLVRQKRGVNAYADSLMDQTDDYRAENARRQREYRERHKGKNGDDAEPGPVNQEQPKKEEDVADVKHRYGKFGKVMLTDDQLSTLKAHFGEKWDHALEILDNYKETTGKKYKSDFGAFYSWVDKRLLEEDNANKGLTFRQIDRREQAEEARAAFPEVMEAFRL